MKQNLVNGCIGVSGSIFGYLFGSWSELLGFFLLVIVIDYVTGCGASIYEGKGLSSSIGFKGLMKKFLMIIVIVIAHRMDILLETNVIQQGAIYFYLANELISITENYGRLGLPLPKRVKEVIATLKERNE